MNKVKVAGILTDYLRPDGSESYGGVGWYRVKNPLEKLGHTVIGKLFLGTPQQALDLKEKGDIWFWKPVDNSDMNVIIDTAVKFTGAKLVLDIDDEPFDINEAHPLYKEIKEKSERVKRLIEISDWLVVSTEQLKQSLKSFGKRTTVIPNAIDTKIWEVKRKKRNDGKIRIGWVGSSSHLADTPVVNEVFDKIIEKYPNVEIHMCGFVGNASERNKREFHHPGTMSYEQFPQFLADLDLDIAVAPLIDTKFNRSKSNIKWLESSMLEIPMVLSKIPPYQGTVKHEKTGFLAKSKHEWIKYLSMLIKSKELREKIGKEAKKEVLKNYLIEKQLPKYEELFEKLRPKDITVYTSNVGGFDKLIEDQNTEGADFIAYTDQPSETWEVREPYNNFKDNRRNSRIQKLMPHLFIKTKYSVYLDGNIKLKVPAQQLIDEYLKDKDIAVFRHMGRDCVYKEAEACVALQKGSMKEIAEQVTAYAEKGHPYHAGLCECGVIIRRHTKEIETMNEKWWAHYCRYSERDQISFPLAFDLDKVEQMEGSAWRHPYFEFVGHANEKDNVRINKTL